MLPYHEERGEVHPPEDLVLHLGDLEEHPEQLPLPLQGGQQHRRGSLNKKYNIIKQDFI